MPDDQQAPHTQRNIPRVVMWRSATGEKRKGPAGTLINGQDWPMDRLAQVVAAKAHDGKQKDKMPLWNGTCSRDGTATGIVCFDLDPNDKAPGTEPLPLVPPMLPGVIYAARSYSQLGSHVAVRVDGLEGRGEDAYKWASIKVAQAHGLDKWAEKHNAKYTDRRDLRGGYYVEVDPDVLTDWEAPALTVPWHEYAEGAGERLLAAANCKPLPQPARREQDGHGEQAAGYGQMPLPAAHDAHREHSAHSEPSGPTVDPEAWLGWMRELGHTVLEDNAEDYRTACPYCAAEGRPHSESPSRHWIKRDGTGFGCHVCDQEDAGTKQQFAKMILTNVGVEAKQRRPGRPPSEDVAATDRRGCLDLVARLGLEWRWNAKHHSHEMRVPDEQLRDKNLDGFGPEWAAIDETDQRIIEGAAKESFRKQSGNNRRPWDATARTWEEARALVRRTRIYDPVAEYWEAARSHPNPIGDPAAWLARLYGGPEGLGGGRQDLLAAALRTLLASIYHRVKTPGIKIDRIANFVGAPGCGKTELAALLTAPLGAGAPTTIKFYSSREKASERDMLWEMHSSAVSIIDEWVGIHPSKMNDVKQLLSETTDKLTLKFEKNPDTVERSFAIYGAMNFAQQLPWDLAMMRRLLTAEMGQPWHEWHAGQPASAMLTEDNVMRLWGGVCARAEAGDPDWSVRGNQIPVAERLTRMADDLYVKHLTAEGQDARRNELSQREAQGAAGHTGKPEDPSEF